MKHAKTPHHVEKLIELQAIIRVGFALSSLKIGYRKSKNTACLSSLLET